MNRIRIRRQDKFLQTPLHLKQLNFFALKGLYIPAQGSALGLIPQKPEP